MENHFNPDLYLDRGEQAYLAHVHAMPGYKVLHKLMRAEVDKFFVVLLNTKAGSEQDVLAAHKMAKAAAQFYEGVTNRINEEIIQYSQAPMASDKPIDITENVLDIGDMPADDDYYL